MARQASCIDGSDSLTNEIMQYFRDVDETEAGRAEKLAVLKEIELIIVKIVPDGKVLVMGSCGNGFQTRDSDLDMTVFFQRSYSGAGFSKSDVGFLRDMERLLKAQKSLYRDIEVIGQAKVPIIKFVSARHSIPCDLSLNNKSAVFNAVLLKAYTQIDDRLKPLFFAVKKWAKAAGILDSRNFRLASFVLQLLVIHYLQSGCVPKVLPALQRLHPVFFSQNITALAEYISKPLPPTVLAYNSTNRQSIGELVTGFFIHYYAFDWGRQGISVREGVNIRRPAKIGSNNTCLYVEDPYERNTNTARAVFKQFIWNNIKREFTKAAEILVSGKGYKKLLANYGVII